MNCRSVGFLMSEAIEGFLHLEVVEVPSSVTLGSHERILRF